MMESVRFERDELTFDTGHRCLETFGVYLQSGLRFQMMLAYIEDLRLGAVELTLLSSSGHDLLWTLVPFRSLHGILTSLSLLLSQFEAAQVVFL